LPKISGPSPTVLQKINPCKFNTLETIQIIEKSNTTAGISCKTELIPTDVKKRTRQTALHNAKDLLSARR
jgi:hypothetical protein